MAEETSKLLDLAISIVVGLVLILFNGWGVLESSMARDAHQVLLELDATELPRMSGLVFRLANGFAMDAIFIVIAVVGLVLLFTIKNRLKAAVLGLALAMLAAGFAVMVKTAAVLPLSKLIQQVAF